MNYDIPECVARIRANVLTPSDTARTVSIEASLTLVEDFLTNIKRMTETLETIAMNLRKED